jgi:hypothetical protein
VDGAKILVAHPVASNGPLELLSGYVRTKRAATIARTSIMNRYILRISLGALGAILAVSGVAAASLCAAPRPHLVTGATNVDAETFSFSYRSNDFPVVIFSGFAPQYSRSSANYCLRYEIENKGSRAIEKLYWPLANDLQLDYLKPRERPSILVTIPPGYQPMVAETMVYAFISEAKKTAAYQRLDKKGASYGVPNGQKTLLASNLETKWPQLEQVSRTSTTILLNEPRELPLIGSEFSNSGAEVSALSSAKWDGKSYTISMSIQQNDPKLIRAIQAPFAYALYKGVPEKYLVDAMAKGFGELPMIDNAFNFSRTYPGVVGVPPIPHLYVVQQPVILDQESGRTCFLAAAYSPTPVPEKSMACNLFERSMIKRDQ